VEKCLAELIAAAQDAPRLAIDLADLAGLDTLGAWVLIRTVQELTAQGCAAEIVGASREHGILLEEVARHPIVPHPEVRTSAVVDFLADIGRSLVNSAKDLGTALSLFGEIVIVTGRVILQPWRFRAAAFVHQVELIALRGVPIIALISFLVGAIVAQQGIFQLKRFGASTYVVDLIGILSLRELGVLLTAIMIAGRSGSAFTAELGSMKMREEIDALRVMGLDPTEVLIVPRLLALTVALPMLTFLSDLAALYGGGLVAWFYGDISPGAFLARLQAAIGMSTFLVGLIKAPFMAVVIAVIASIEGFAVRGSAESLGQHVTSSVVKSIFMVIVMDGLFAMFFAAIDY
jgi:phospholipid/cholesterol/gamma-HCH transport system permease protein